MRIALFLNVLTLTGSLQDPATKVRDLIDKLRSPDVQQREDATRKLKEPIP